MTPKQSRPDAELWTKFVGNPVLGGELGTCFDMSVDVSGDRYRMWFSWRPRHGIGFAESPDGLHWIAHHDVVLGPERGDEELEVTRPFVLVEGNQLTMWYAAHRSDRVSIARATSCDGLTWQRAGIALEPQRPWEKSTLMCPSVLHEGGQYHLWYSGGERYEPDAIGYATSPDGVRWTRVSDDPVLTHGEEGSWEADRVAGAHVFRHDGWFYAAYIGFADGFEDSSIGIARSRDGRDWERHADNPVITRGRPGEFDSINVYKPFVHVAGDQWRVWFNGSSPMQGDDTSPSNRIEQIGVAWCRFQFRSADSNTS